MGKPTPGARAQKRYRCREGLRHLKGATDVLIETELAGVYATGSGFFIRDSDIDPAALGLTVEQSKNEAKVDRAVIRYFSSTQKVRKRTCVVP